MFDDHGRVSNEVLTNERLPGERDGTVHDEYHEHDDVDELSSVGLSDGG